VMKALSIPWRINNVMEIFEKLFALKDFQFHGGLTENLALSIPLVIPKLSIPWRINVISSLLASSITSTFFSIPWRINQNEGSISFILYNNILSIPWRINWRRGRRIRRWKTWLSILWRIDKQLFKKFISSLPPLRFQFHGGLTGTVSVTITQVQYMFFQFHGGLTYFLWGLLQTHKHYQLSIPWRINNTRSSILLSCIESLSIPWRINAIDEALHANRHAGIFQFHGGLTRVGIFPTRRTFVTFNFMED